MTTYFLQLDPLFRDAPWRVCYRKVETTDPTSGLPLSWQLVALPGHYDDPDKAQDEADRLNRMEQVRQ